LDGPALFFRVVHLSSSGLAVDRRCPDCGSDWLRKGQLSGVARVAARLTTRRPHSCKCGWRGWIPPSADRAASIAAGDSDPFSLFIPEADLQNSKAAAAIRSETAKRAPSTSFVSRWTDAAHEIRWTIAAFALGVVGGASPLLWMMPYSSSSPSVQAQQSSQSTSQPVPAAPPPVASPPAERSSGAGFGDVVTVASLPPVLRDTPRVPARVAVQTTTATRQSAPSPSMTRRPRSVTAAPPSVVLLPGSSGQRPVPFHGSLAVDSSPSGARIALDGRTLGVTPLVVQRVPVGSHVVRLEMDGHRVSASAVRVVANRSTKIAVALDPNSSP
jgi:hypothetical protein